MGPFNNGYIIYFDLVALILMIILLLAYHTIKHLATIQNRLLLVMLYSNFVVVVMDLITVLGPQFPPTANYTFSLISYLMYYLMHSLTVFAFFVYCCFLVDQYAKGKMWLQLLFVMPLLGSYALMLTNAWTGWVYVIGEDLQYERGSHVWIVYLVAGFYVFMSLAIITIYRRKITKLQLGVTYLYLFLGVVSVGIQYVNPQLLVESFAVSLALLVMFFITAKFTELYDDTYKVLNARAFHDMIHGSVHWLRRFHVIVVKVHDLQLYRLAMGKEFQEGFLKAVIRYVTEQYPEFDVFHYTTSAIVMRSRKSLSNETVQEIVNRLTDRFEKSWEIGDNEIRCSYHIAMFECGDDAPLNSATQLKEYLDYINDYSKRIDKKVLGIEEMRIGALARTLLVQRLLQEAVENDGFEMYYQPIYSMKEHRVVSAEALIRLKNTEHGFISPEEFIPVAEQNGLIMRIGEFAFRSVCSFIQSHDLKKLGIQYIEVNLSVVQCMQQKLSEQLVGIMKEYDLSPEQINLEITETAEAIRFDAFRENVYTLRNQGFHLSLDDYGTGYSNIGFLYKFPFRFIKIDKSLLWGAFENDKAMITFVSSVELAKRLELEIVVEGVETEEHVRKLMELECEYLQGYYFSKPIPQEAFIQYMKEFPNEKIAIQ